MADDVDYEILGDDMQLVEVELDPGEAVRAETGAMCYMDEGIAMDTGTGGGIFSGLKRMISGESFFITSFSNAGRGKKRVAFAAPYPGKIIPLDLSKFATNLVPEGCLPLRGGGHGDHGRLHQALRRRAFRRLGLICNGLWGRPCLCPRGGTIVKKTLAPGQILKGTPGVSWLRGGLDYDIGFVGGFTNALFGGEGIFLAQLRGPARCTSELPFSRLADRVATAARVTTRTR
jgi:uncharacterized protein (AIM24 family)